MSEMCGLALENILVLISPIQNKILVIVQSAYFVMDWGAV